MGEFGELRRGGEEGVAAADVGDVIVVVVELEALVADDAVDGADGGNVRLAADVFLQQPVTTSTRVKVMPNSSVIVDRVTDF